MITTDTVSPALFMDSLILAFSKEFRKEEKEKTARPLLLFLYTTFSVDGKRSLFILEKQSRETDTSSCEKTADDQNLKRNLKNSP